MVRAWSSLPHYAYPGLLPEHYLLPYEEGARRVLNEQLGYIAGAGGIVARADLLMGRAADAILDLGERIGADLMVVGSKGWDQ